MRMQQEMPGQPVPKRPLTMRAGLKTPVMDSLALLRLPIVGIWTLLIFAAIAGIVGDAGFTLLTTGKVNLAGTAIVFAWLLARLALILTILLLFLAITICSLLAYRRKQQMLQQATRDQQRRHEKSLGDIVTGVTDMSKGILDVAAGFRQSLDELKTQSTTNSVASSPQSGNQGTSSSNFVWNVPYPQNPLFTGREDVLKQLYDNLFAHKTTALT